MGILGPDKIVNTGNIGNPSSPGVSGSTPQSGLGGIAPYNPNDPTPGAPNFAGKAFAMFQAYVMSTQTPSKPTSTTPRPQNINFNDDDDKKKKDSEDDDVKKPEEKAKAEAPTTPAKTEVVAPVVESTEPHYGKPVEPEKVMAQKMKETSAAAGDSTNAIIDAAAADLTATHPGFAGNASIGGAHLDE